MRSHIRTREVDVHIGAIDWALLSSSLEFLFLDPVLRYHLREQASRILGCSLLDFVHPEEQDLARRDLGEVLDERALYGSVTR